MACGDQISTCNMYAETNNIQTCIRHWFGMMQPRNHKSLGVSGYEWLYESLCNPDQPCQISKVVTRGSLWQPHPQVDKHRVEPGMSLRGQIQNPLAKFFV